MATDTLSAVPTLFRLLGRGMRGQELAYSFNVSDRCPIRKATVATAVVNRFSVF